MYSAWVKIDDSLPWIELKEAFQTRTEAQEATKEKLSKSQNKDSGAAPAKEPNEGFDNGKTLRLKIQETFARNAF
jgi:hypothetical protein